MDDPNLSQLETAWSVIRRAHDDRSDVVRLAQQQLLDRYGGAIERYLIAATRDPDTAADIFQEFSLKFLSGKLRSADPDRGRFRTFLRSILFRMVADHHRQRQRRPLKQIDDGDIESVAISENSEESRTFQESWRMGMLARAWDRLSQDEAGSSRSDYSVLRLRTDQPELSSLEVAEQLSQQLGRTISSGNLRVMLHRARDRFGDLLLSEVAETLESVDREAIEQELIDLQLLEYCRSALDRVVRP